MLLYIVYIELEVNKSKVFIQVFPQCKFREFPKKSMLFAKWAAYFSSRYL